MIKFTPWQEAIESEHDDTLDAKKVVQVGGGSLPVNYDYMALTYYNSGPGNGQIETVTYKLGGSGGVTKAVQTLTYNGSGLLETVSTVLS